MLFYTVLYCKNFVYNCIVEKAKEKKAKFYIILGLKTIFHANVRFLSKYLHLLQQKGESSL